MFFERHENRRTWFLGRQENRRTGFFERHENKRTCFLGGDKRTEEHVFWKTWEQENMRRRARIDWAKREQEVWLGVAQHSFLAVSSLKPLDFSLFTLHFSLNIWIFHSSLFTLHLTSPLLVVSTERRPHRSSFYFNMLLGATVMTTYHYGCRNPISLIMSFTTLNFTLETSLLS